jgi:hypothetical protein
MSITEEMFIQLITLLPEQAKKEEAAIREQPAFLSPMASAHMVLCQVLKSIFNFKINKDCAMHTKMKTFERIINILLLALAGFIFSCDGFHEKIVSLDAAVENVDRVVVINGKIEEGQAVWVQISYTEDIDASLATPINYEENASVDLRAGNGSQEQLIYFGEGQYSGSNIIGTVNEIYTMTIEIAGQTYTATSTMLPPPGYRDAWVVSNEKTGGYTGYSEEWRVLDAPETRDRYLFEWWTNGWHNVVRDWAIDDNRVVNAGGSLRLFNVTTDPGLNEYVVFRAAKIDKVTYDYYNMYEKIVRGIVNVDSQTPYNPASNFGEGTIGNFRAVAYSSIAVLIPPGISAAGQDKQNVIEFPLNKYFTKYNLYWSTTPGVTKTSNVINDLDYKISDKSNAVYTHQNLTSGASYYYSMEVEDADGNVSILSPETSAAADTSSSTSGNAPTNVSAIAGTGEITISWDTVTGAYGYVIFWDTNQGVTSSSNKISGDKNKLSSPYTHKGLSSGKTYYYRVAAYIGDPKTGYSDVHLSEEVSATPN